MPAPLTVHRQRDDDNGCIEGADGLHAEQLEGHGAFHGAGQRIDAGLRRAAQLAGLGAQPFIGAGELLRFLPRQPDPCPAPAVGQPVQHELGKA